MAQGGGWAAAAVGLLLLVACGPGGGGEPGGPTPGSPVGGAGVEPGGNTPDGDGGGGGGPPDGGGAPDGGGGGGTDDGGTPPAPLAFPPVQTRLTHFALQLAPADLERLLQNPTSDVMVPVTVTYEGQSAPGRARFRGASTRTLPQKSWKVELDPGHEFQDRDHFELLAQYNDGGKLSEKFAVDLFEALGLQVPRARYVRVSVNGVHQGLYLDMEKVGKDYVEHHGLEEGASVYRAWHRDGELKPGVAPLYGFEKKTNEAAGIEELHTFLRWVNRSDDAEFERLLAERVDLEALLGNIAADALISNNIIEDSRSYWVHETRRDRWVFVPWDLNNARLFYWRNWGVTDPPITHRPPPHFSLYDPDIQAVYNMRRFRDGQPGHRPTWSVLYTRIWDRPGLRERIVKKLEAALAGPFREEVAEAHIDRLFAFVRPELLRDPHVGADTARIDQAPRHLKRFVRERRAYLQRTLAALRAHGQGGVVVRELAAGPRGYLVLENRSGARVSLGGRGVTHDLRRPTLHRLPAGLALAPGATLRLEADGNPAAGPTHLPFTLSEEGGEVGLFDGEVLDYAYEQQNADGTRTPVHVQAPKVYGPLDVVYYGPLRAGTAYGRRADRPEDFERRPAQP